MAAIKRVSDGELEELCTERGWIDRDCEMATATAQLCVRLAQEVRAIRMGTIDVEEVTLEIPPGLRVSVTALENEGQVIDIDRRQFGRFTESEREALVQTLRAAVDELNH